MIATFTLAYHYEMGRKRATEKNEEMAIKLYKEAAEQNHCLSILNLGVLHEDKETKEDLIKAITFYEKANKLNYSSSMVNLGIIYLNGKKGMIEKNVDLAIVLLEKAANANHPSALFCLASFYEDESNEKYDILKAIQYHERGFKIFVKSFCF